MRESAWQLFSTGEAACLFVEFPGEVGMFVLVAFAEVISGERDAVRVSGDGASGNIGEVGQIVPRAERQGRRRSGFC